MKGRYTFSMFILCFFVWVLVVDQVVIPGNADLQQKTGTYSRYRVKNWTQNGKLDFLKDELLVYVDIKEGSRLRERLFYMEYKPYFEASLKVMAKGDPVTVQFDQRFPKVWKSHLYNMRKGGIPVVSYSSRQLAEKQKEIWKFTGIMVGAFLMLTGLGLINKPRRT